MEQLDESNLSISSENKITHQTPLNCYEHQVQELNTEHPTNSVLSTNYTTEHQSKKTQPDHVNHVTKTQSTSKPPVRSDEDKKPKIYVLSNNNRNKILQAISHHYEPNQFTYSHHIKTGVGIKILLNNLSTELLNYTKNDYCIVLIGEADFKYGSNLKSLHDFENLIQYIRETLEKISNTNIILAMPTYVCGAMIFNHNVEIFNTLLYRDTLKNNYAYFFDSNADLSFDMFSEHTGKLTNTGYNELFANLRTFIQDLDKNTRTSDLSDLPHDKKTEKKPEVNQFFLL
ncbi:hypothetical protein O0L34_g6883 [Tuta absoluta]|nr:hypothetical protein O0L34_g6883 [Tuta absoluta]